MIVDHLNALGAEAELKIEYLNHGGCCVFAALIARELQNKGYKASGVVVSYGAEESENSVSKARKMVANNTVYEWNDKALYFSHVGVEFKIDGFKHRYDSYGVVGSRAKLMNMPAYRGRLTVVEMEELAADTGWNPQFNRKQIPKLKRIVKKHFAKIEAVAA